MPFISDYKKYRILEIIPGFLVWGTFILAVVLSFIAPLYVIYFIILFDLYWLIRVIYILVYLLMAYKRFCQAKKVNWIKKCQKLKGWQDVIHLVFIPTYKDDINVIRTTLKYLARVSFPLDKFYIILACEENEGEKALPKANKLKDEFGELFNKFVITYHPKNVPGEMPGKGSNIAYAGKEVKKIIDQKNISYKNIIVSSFDVDTCVHRQYFSYLTYSYLTDPNPTRKSYQPIPLFNNNIWDSPALTRVASNSTTFWLLSETIRPDRLFTFSSHSMSFKALVDVGFWQSDIVTEDSRIFVQGLIRYNGHYKVKPMYIPISMDTVLGHNFWESMKNLYKQQRRWAYGVENFPFMFWNFWGNKQIKLGSKIKYIWNQLEGVYSWATAPILIFVLGHLPIWVINNFERPQMYTMVAQNTPYILRLLMTSAMIGLFVSAIISLVILPPKPKKKSSWRYPLMLLQWILFPFSMIIFGSLPATDAQTRLMLGKYLGFQATKKVRKN
ncbi:MAG: glycosyltransferase family 2 protein [Patescibacteria group bacterium]|nr:glycosyltransferase family 2 protein [Patescibacteria group bacterium]